MSATKVTPTSSESSRSPTQTGARKRMRRLSFADEYDGGQLENTVFADNLHYSQDQVAPAAGRDARGDEGSGGGGGGGCCVIS